LLFSIRSSASLTKNDILPPLSYVLIFSFYHICFFLPIMQWSSKVPNEKKQIVTKSHLSIKKFKIFFIPKLFFGKSLEIVIH
ncbi:hypothetical protein, partial [Candidatus Bandiella numerosa]|uniref:hypothetical protein n=1 Tax=Candidatus Bandiella numerosa TaxID=2570586 RepID=UPI001F39D18D